MKLREEVSRYSKEVVFDSYCRIVENFKNYSKITKAKMLDEICNTYADYQNIIDICTVRELKFLEKVVFAKEEFDLEQYSWEIENLKNKYLIFYYPVIHVPDDLYDVVCLALEKIDWNIANENDRRNEVLVGICKAYGEIDSNVLLTLGVSLLGVTQEALINHLASNHLFHYYIYFTVKELSGMNREVGMFIYQDYYELIEELEAERKIPGVAYSKEFDVQDFIHIFYHNLNINRKEVKKFYLLAKDLFKQYYPILINEICIYSLLNSERETLKKNMNFILKLDEKEFKDFCILLDKAMDEMPSGALNGATPNDLKFIRLEEEKNQFQKEVNYLKQTNANLSKKEANLFYKLYFALLQYTNDKYHISSKLKKIYKKSGLNPFELSPIIDKFWDERDEIIDAFIENNPYRFHQEELNFIEGFKRGIRNIFVVARFDLEYTELLLEDKVYMVKGLHGNIDEIISYQVLPYVVKTTILPFGDNIVYDGIFQGVKDINFGTWLDRTVHNDLKNSEKIYRL